MQITDEHRKKLSDMIHFALMEIRLLGGARKSKRAADLADAFHELPQDMWREDFNLEFFRDYFLKPYQKKYSKRGGRNFVRMINEMLAAGEDYRTN